MIRPAILALLILPTPLFAWGRDGHRIACGITWQRLDASARAMVAKLLGADDEKTFVDACLWADEVRDARPETYAFHFVNIPAGRSGLDLRRDCGDAQKRCAPWAITHYTRVLADPKAGDAARLDALRFVLHFVGDLHQPLHAGRPDDRGGNEINVEFFGYAGTTDRPMNLHSVWDTQILRRAGGTWPEMSRRLAKEISTDDAKQWESLDVVAWTNESYRICEEYVYGRLPADGKLGSAYFDPALSYIEMQLQRAGVRLAHVLNQAAAGRALPAI